MFTSQGFEDVKSNSTEMKDFAEKTVEDFLKFIYCENLLKEDFTPELLLMAEKYNVENLTQRCQATLIETLNSENALEVLKAAFLTNQDSLMKKARDFLYKKPSILISNEWCRIMKAHPSLCDTLHKLE